MNGPLHAVPAAGSKRPLGERLLAAGVITRPQLDLALREGRRQGMMLGESLVALGFVTAEALTSSLADEANSEVVDVASAVVDDAVLALVSHELAKRHRALPLRRDGDVLTVVLSNALNVVAIDALERATGLRLDVATAPEADLVDAIERHYAQRSSIEETIDAIMREGIVGDSDEDDAQASGMIRLVEEIIALGVKARATDIHLEQEERIIRVRIRVDGILRQEVLIPVALGPALAARVKVIAGLNVSEKRVPQDGRINFKFGRREVDLRVSTLPTQYGESLVMRILEKGNIHVNFDQIGLSPASAERLLEAVARPHGMVLVTGPTGSGKTTTLYTVLGQVDAMQLSVFTLEDPIEYGLPLIRQTQVKPDIGLTFASGLRALLRQDPDVILLGEIRDAETAQLAVRAALTGHLLLSTLHTNDAIGAIPRLVDMGIEPYLLTSALSAVVGQRLVRRICSGCKTEVENPAEEYARLSNVIGTHEVGPLWVGAGCNLCRNSGYRGRVAIYEVLVVDERFHAPILKGVELSQLRQLAADSGMQSMLEDGLAKARAGLTTLDELVRVVR
ncbi:MAG: Flp pilus assembly complex ATPase component TadA [Proteobacteria bacterium]|nr:Flp pilus assembly complex ATPase component TadA [Pseudomonadota bacterium]